MNREIDINKFNKSITFQNRGIGFTQIGIAKEILDLIDDLQQENKQLKEKIDKIREHCKKEYFIDESGKSVIDKADRILELLGDKENE